MEDNAMTPQDEVTKVRPGNYSAWHRHPTLPRWCYQTDGDWFEQRLCNGNLVSVAYVETIQLPDSYCAKMASAKCDYPLNGNKWAVMREISDIMGIRCFTVRHTPDCKHFSVAEVASGREGKSVVMDECQYKAFIQGLGPTHRCPLCKHIDWTFYNNDEDERKSEWRCEACDRLVPSFVWDIPFDPPGEEPPR